MNTYTTHVVLMDGEVIAHKLTELVQTAELKPLTELLLADAIILR